MPLPPRPLEERFWEKVDRSGGPDACWEWTGALNREGYGHFRLVGSGSSAIARANRVSYALEVGPIPDDLLVLHHCDNRACVNPKHLYLGDQSDNMNDMWSRCRRAKPGKRLELQRRTA